MKFHPDVLRCHEQFGGDLEDMQRRYNASTSMTSTTKPTASARPAADDAGVREALQAMLRLFDDQGNMVADFAQLQDAVNGGYRALLAKREPKG